jgi:hypothetical protein
MNGKTVRNQPRIISVTSHRFAVSKLPGEHMPQNAALNALVSQTPFNYLIGGQYSVIWVKKTVNGDSVSGRRKSDDAVVSLASAGAPALVRDLDSALGGALRVDVEVGGVAYGITKIAIVGGTEYAMVEHARIPATARGVPTVVI